MVDMIHSSHRTALAPSGKAFQARFGMKFEFKFKKKKLVLNSLRHDVFKIKLNQIINF